MKKLSFVLKEDSRFSQTVSLDGVVVEDVCSISVTIRPGSTTLTLLRAETPKSLEDIVLFPTSMKMDIELEPEVDVL